MLWWKYFTRLKNTCFCLSTGKSLYVDRLFEKFQQKSPRANHLRIRLIEPCVDIDSFIKSLSEKLAPLREQDPVLLHIDTAGVSIQACTSVDHLFCCWLYVGVCLLIHCCYLSGLLRPGGAPVPSVSAGLFERQSWHAVEKKCSSLDHCWGPENKHNPSEPAKTGINVFLIITSFQ